jgi:hypothetical protein
MLTCTTTGQRLWIAARPAKGSAPVLHITIGGPRTNAEAAQEIASQTPARACRNTTHASRWRSHAPLTPSSSRTLIASLISVEQVRMFYKPFYRRVVRESLRAHERVPNPRIFLRPLLPGSYGGVGATRLLTQSTTEPSLTISASHSTRTSHPSL